MPYTLTMEETTSVNPSEIAREIIKRTKPINEGDPIDGEVLEKKAGKLFINLGMLGVGVVYGRGYKEAGDIIKNLKIGDRVSAKIVDLERDDGYIELSLKDAGQMKQWEELRELEKSRQLIEAQVLEANRGGILVEARGIRGFIPVSQLSIHHYPRVEGGDKEKILRELNKLIGQTLKLRVIAVDQKNNKLILSEKEAESERVAKILSTYKMGDIIEGEIVGLTKFGAFIRFGDPPLEGLIHISEISYQLVEDPADFVKIGNRVKTKIVSIENGKVNLSLKALEPDPWQDFASLHKVGDIIEGEVAKEIPGGFLVKMDAHIFGFWAVPEEKRGIIELGEKHRFKLNAVNLSEKKINLTLEE